MKQMPQDLRAQTLELINANDAADTAPDAALISAWLGSLDDEDLADPQLAIECQSALEELMRILALPGLYDLS